jgi:hypothetical protein
MLSKRKTLLAMALLVAYGMQAEADTVAEAAAAATAQAAAEVDAEGAAFAGGIDAEGAVAGSLQGGATAVHTVADEGRTAAAAAGAAVVDVSGEVRAETRTLLRRVRDDAREATEIDGELRAGAAIDASVEADLGREIAGDVDVAVEHEIELGVAQNVAGAVDAALEQDLAAAIDANVQDAVESSVQSEIGAAVSAVLGGR